MAMALAGATSAAGPGGARSAASSTPGGHLKAAGAAFVKQLGARNYAGPNCPGAGWNCTTSTRVFQATSSGGQNVAECVGTGSMEPPGPGSPENAVCLFVHNGSSNVAKCNQKSSFAPTVQSCTITQTGASNTATVSQYISQTTGADQDATQTAVVKQGSETQRSSAYNVVKVTQSVSQGTKTSDVDQTQDAYQKATVEQWAGGSGYNLSDVNQSELQKAYGGSSQKQNAAAANTADCFLNHSPDNPNTCADVMQDAEGGTNTNTLNQSLDQDANTSALGDVPLGAVQIQGSSEGGLEGHVHQASDTGSSSNKGKQDKRQKANGPSSASQTQYDPVSCCGTFSIIGAGTDDINQSSSIDATDPFANQHSRLIGESRTPGGSCTVNQRATIDGASASNSESLSPCPFLILTTACSSFNPDVEAVFPGSDTCTAFSPETGEPDSRLSKEVRPECLEGPCDPYASSASIGDGGRVEYRISYFNDGTVDAHSVTVTDVLSNDLSYVSCSGGSSCSYDPDTRTITWNLDTVAPTGEFPQTVFFTAAENAGCDRDTVQVSNTAEVRTKEEPLPKQSNSADVSVATPPCIN